MGDENQEKKILLNMDISAILDALPVGATLPLHPAPGRGYPGSGSGDNGIIKKTDDGYIFIPVNKPYPKERIYRDIANQRIYIGELLLQLGKNPNALKAMEFDEKGNLKVYNSTLEEVQEEKIQLKSDALILFVAKFTSEEIKEQGDLLDDEPVKLPYFVYEKIKATHQTAKMNAHHFSDEALREVKERLDHPLAIIRTKTKDGGEAIAVLTGAKDYKGNLTMVVMAPDEKRGDNYISSIYGKERVVSYLKHQQEAGNLSYINPEIKDHLAGNISEEDMSKLDEVLGNVMQQKLQEKTTLASIKSTIKNKRGGNAK